MPRFKETDRDQGVMIPISYKEQILSGTFEHAIDYIADNRINTEALEARYRNDETGAGAYSPKALLKIVLFAYSRGIISSRKIEQACHENVKSGAHRRASARFHDNSRICKIAEKSDKEYIQGRPAYMQ